RIDRMGRSRQPSDQHELQGTRTAREAVTERLPQGETRMAAKNVVDALQRKYGKLITPVQIIVLPDGVSSTAQAKKKLRKSKAKPQDIIVHGSHSGHFVGSAIVGEAHAQLAPHADRTLITLSAKKQSMIAWSSKKKFSIVDIQPIEGYAYKKGSPYE